MESLLWSILGYVVFPFWLLIGLLDFAMHQRTRIAATSGMPESALHLVQTTQIGIPVLIVLFLEINVLTLSIVAAFVLAHTLTAFWDIAYTATRRHITPFEQFVHAFMIVLPILALLLLTVLHWSVARQLADPGSATTAESWGLGLREAPWNATVVVTVLGASGAFALLPAMAELYQTARAAALRHTSNPGGGAGQQSSR